MQETNTNAGVLLIQDFFRFDEASSDFISSIDYLKWTSTNFDRNESENLNQINIYLKFDRSLALIRGILYNGFDNLRYE